MSYRLQISCVSFFLLVFPLIALSKTEDNNKQSANKYANDPLIKEMYGDNPIDPLEGVKLSDLYRKVGREDLIDENTDNPPHKLPGITSTQDSPSPFRVALERGSIGNVVTEGVPQGSDWGESKYDENLITNEELANYQQNRVEKRSSAIIKYGSIVFILILLSISIVLKFGKHSNNKKK